MGKSPFQIYVDEKTPEILKLKKEGYINAEIARKVNRSPQSVARTLSSWTPDRWRELKAIIAKVQKTRFFMLDVNSPEMRAAALKHWYEVIDELARQGVWHGPPPFGYLLTAEGKLKPHPEQAKLVREVLQGFRDGKTVPQLSREMKLPNYTVANIIRRLEIYAGNTILKTRMGVKFFPKTHEAIITGQLKKDVEIALKYRRERPWLYCPLMDGFTRGKFGYWIKDPVRGPKILEMFQLFLNNKNISETARLTKTYPIHVWNILRNPIYANRRRVQGKPPEQWPEAGVEKIVPFDTWLKVQRVRASQKKEMVYARAMQKKRDATKEKVYEALRKLKRASASQLTAKVGMHSVEQVIRYLKELREDPSKNVDKEPGCRGKWFLVKSPK